VLYSILIEYGIPMKLVRPITMHLYKNYSQVRKGKIPCDSFPIQNGLKQRDALPPFLSNFTLEHAIRNGWN
jgi:hypothetical protein